MAQFRFDREKRVIAALGLFLITGLGVSAYKKSAARPVVGTGQFSYKDNKAISDFDSARQARRVNINTATLEELETLKGVGERIARRIADHRSSKGAFSSVEDLSSVKGVGQKILAENRDRLTVE